MIRAIWAFLFCIACVCCATKPDDIVGNWRTKGGESVIRIERVGAVFQGGILWLKEPADKDGHPKVDKNNPDEKLRSRAILGLQLLRGFRFDGKNTWEDGRIYDPKSGKDYDCTIKLDDNGDLSVHGFIGIALLGRTETWVRASKTP